MSKAIAIGGKSSKKSAPTVPQSLPANFYRGYVPPKTPHIDPIPEPAMDDLLDLPPPSQESVGLNLQTGSFSLNNNKHPMSMPVNSGFMGGLKNRVNFNQNTNNSNRTSNKHGAISEIKEDDPANAIASGVSKMQMTVGSFTTLQIMGGDNNSTSSFADQDEIGSNNMNANVNDNTNFNSNNNGKTLASAASENPNQDDDDDDQFDMED